MKKLISIITLLFSIVVFSQDTKMDSIVRELKELRKSTKMQFIEMGGSEYAFDEYDHVEGAFRTMKENLLALENLNNKQVQKAFVQPIANLYYDFYNYESDGKILNALKFGFTDKSSLQRHLLFEESVMLSNIVKGELADIQKKHDAFEEFVNKNLKRLQISRKDWDNMSENDKRLLLQKFE